MSALAICHFDSLLRNDCSNNQKHSDGGHVSSTALTPPPAPITLKFMLNCVQFGEAYSAWLAIP